MDIKPINYNLTFEPDLEKFVFKGREVITLKVDNTIKKIVLDAVELKIVNCQLLIAGKNIVTAFNTEDQKNKLIINLTEELKSGEYGLEIEFEGKLNDNLAGFYRSSYLSFTSGVNKNKKYLATTQFEAADARRAFPCFDNPSYKATFDVSLIVDKSLTAISNTIQLPTSGVGYDVKTLQSGKKIYSFATTPKMSIYLLYLGVGEFEFYEDKYKNVLIRGITTPGKSQYTKFAVDCLKKFLKYYEEYFNYPYPLAKLDLIAIPDFASGAMENWGAITFRENALLFYPGKSSKTTMIRISEVVAHELTHQWFGNLVTMKWWDDLWLNESFATYMAYKAIDHFWPEWNIWSQYITDTIFSGMFLDSLNSSHPIKVKINNVEEAEEIFDEISYDKGGSVLRMLDNYLGEEVFRNGLQKYIAEFKFKNAEGSDLWNSLESVSETPVKILMEKYLVQTGFPFLKVKKENKSISFEQNRFLFEDKRSDNSLWDIPLVIQSDKDKFARLLLNKKEDNLKLVEVKFVNVNQNYSGFFISSYSKELLDKLGENIKLLNNTDRIGLIHDLFALTLAGKEKLDKLIYIIYKFYKNEKNSVVLTYIVGKLSIIHLLLKDGESKKLAIEFSKNALKLVGYEPIKKESVHEAVLRSTALSCLSRFDDKEIQKFSLNKFKNYLINDRSLNADLRGVVYSSSVWSNEKNYEIVKNLFRKSLIQEEKAKFLSALANTKNKNLVSDGLKFILNKEVPFAQTLYYIAGLSRNPFAKDLALDWLIINWNELVKRSGGLSNILLRRTLQSIIPICGIGREKEAISFLKSIKLEGLQRTIQQTEEELRINTLFVKIYRK